MHHIEIYLQTCGVKTQLKVAGKLLVKYKLALAYVEEGEEPETTMFMEIITWLGWKIQALEADLKMLERQASSCPLP